MRMWEKRKTDVVLLMTFLKGKGTRSVGERTRALKVLYLV